MMVQKEKDCINLIGIIILLIEMMISMMVIMWIMIEVTHRNAEEMHLNR